LKQVVVNAKAAKRLLQGYPWIFSGQIEEWRPKPDPGELVSILDTQGILLGFAYANPDNILALKYLYTPAAASRGQADRPDEALEIARKLDRCRSQRAALSLDSNAYRLVWSEADGLPGLICDDYHGFIVVQFLTRGMDQRRQYVLDWLISRMKPKGIFERSEGHGRSLEGLAPKRQWLWQPDPGHTVDHCEIKEGPDLFQVDFEKGHKTGFYLDQRAARRVLRAKTLKGKVLDAFCHSGGFSLAAVRAGAAQVEAIDRDTSALKQLEHNAQLNQAASSIQPIEADVFIYLRAAAMRAEKYNAVILDPPSFVRSRSAIEDAMRGYRELHLQAGKLLQPGARLLTCTCSHHIGRTPFRQMVLGTMQSAGKRLEHIRVFGPDKDHPEKSQIPESRYLTCLLARVKAT